jgi:hypothetical protein
MKNNFLFTLLCFFGIITVYAQDVTITVNATQNKRLISPYIYGKNDGNDQPAQFYKDAGLHFSRMNGGNDASAHNWRLKLEVHPDWYNNVYGSDWDVLAKNVSDNLPGMQAMFAFQLLGRAASSGQHNFDDWGYNQSQYWSGVGQNLAGGGTPNTVGGSKALVDGDINLFSEPWTADSSVGILNYWFGTNGKGFNKNQFQYWSMDNEVDIWNGTHDWAMPTQLSASAFMDRYIELAYKAKALYPGIKLCGPVTTSEWQWYKWSNESIWINGRYYPWIEYFIKRLGDEYKATGIKLVDVIDIHNYPWYNNNTEALQGHRIYYDTSYVYPGSNGIKTSTGGWDNSLGKQYFFKRVEGWLNEEFGVNNGISPGVSEWGTMTSNSNPNIESVIYASHLGTFANNGVELFSPWNWSIGMWETLHLFSRNAKNYSVSSISSLEDTVSAYTSVNNNLDSMTVIIVNRDMNAAYNVVVNLNGCLINDGSYKTLQLASLPTNETFVSDADNALKQGTAMVKNKTITISVPSMSTTAIILTMPLQQTIALKKGWNLISFNVSPSYKQIDSVFKSIIANVTEIKTFDGFWEKGQNAAFNSLTAITDGAAYLVYLTAPTTLTVIGKPVSLPLTINVKSGWNLIGIPLQAASSIATIVGSKQISIVKNLDGYWQTTGIPSITTFDLGKGYLIKATTASSISW